MNIVVPRTEWGIEFLRLLQHLPDTFLGMEIDQRTEWMVRDSLLRVLDHLYANRGHILDEFGWPIHYHDLVVAVTCGRGQSLHISYGRRQ